MVENFPSLSWAYPASYPMGTAGPISGVKREAYHSPPRNAEAKKTWIYAATLFYAFMD
jgi:hypothetical protein